ncbi:MAG: MFS transporter [Microthrixaceae bacterium]
MVPHRGLLLVGIVALITVVATESMAITTVMPLVEDDLGDLWLYGWAFSAFFLGDLVGIVVGGRAADRVRPSVPLLIGLAVFGAGLLLGGLAPTMPVLVLGRALQGVGAGVVPAVAYVCVARGFPAPDRPRVFAIMSTAWVVPSLVAPLAASAVATSVGWRWVFLGLVPVTLVAGLLAVGSLRGIGTGPEGAEHEATPLGRVLTLVAGAALLVGGLGAASPWVGLPAVVAGLALGVPALAGLTPPGTLRVARGLPAAVAVRGVLTFAFFSADAFISLALTSVRGTTTLFAGVTLAVASFTWTAGAWTQARLIPSWGAARLERLAGVVLVVGLLCLLAGLWEAVPVGIWVVGSCVAGLGIGLGYAPLSAVALEQAQPGREGVASSALQLTDVLGIALGTGVAGVVVSSGDRLGVDRAPTLAVVFGLSAAVGLLVVVLAGRLRPPSPAGGQDAATPPTSVSRS